METEELLTSDEVAQILKLTRPALELRRHRGQAPPHLRLGAAIRYRPADLREWIDSLPREEPAKRAAGAGGGR